MNLISYVKKDQTEIDTPREADLLVFTWFSYFSYNGQDKETDFASLRGFEKENKRMFDTSFNPSESRRFFHYACKNRRYRNAVLCDYTEVSGEDVRFAAITFKINNYYVVAFRGTDPSYESWKEMFTSSFKPIIPSQVLAKQYLEQSIDKYDGMFYVVGHSKGANIALFAYNGLEDKSRIASVTAFEPHGFSDIEILGYNSGEDDKISIFLPQESFVGGIYSLPNDYYVVKSRGFGVFQHNPFLWHIENGCFVRVKEISRKARQLQLVFNKWLKETDKDDKILFTEILFREIRKIPCTDFNDFFKRLVTKGIPGIINVYLNLEKNDKVIVKKVIRILRKNYRKRKYLIDNETKEM